MIFDLQSATQKTPRFRVSCKPSYILWFSIHHIESAILNPPSWILKIFRIWPHICITDMISKLFKTEKPKFTIFPKLSFNSGKSVSQWEYYVAKYQTLDKIYVYDDLLWIVLKLTIIYTTVLYNFSDLVLWQRKIFSLLKIIFIASKLSLDFKYFFESSL